MAVPNVNQITSVLRNMPDNQLQQYAAMHKSDPYVMSLAVAESNARKQLRSSQQAQMAGQKPPTVADQAVMSMTAQDRLPEQQGIGALAAPNMQNMADGGIAGYGEDSPEQLQYNNEPVIRMAEGGIARFADKGAVQGSPEQYRAYAVQKAEKMGLDPIWVDRILQHESQYKADAVSPTGATGIGQLVKKTANHYMRKTGHLGLQDKFDPEIRKDPYKNIDASLAFMVDLKQKYKGDPRLMAVGYNQGETYLDEHLKANEGKLNPAALKNEPKNYLQKTVEQFVPSATAAEVTGKAAPQAQATPVEPRSQFGAIRDAAKGVVGAGETALQYATGLAAIPTAGGAAVLGQVPNILSGRGADRAEMEKSFREKAGQVTYEPRTEGGQAVSEGFARTLDDLKIPPYLAHMGNLSPTRGRKGIPAAELEALAKTKEAEAAAAAAKTQNLRLEPPRKETPSSFTVDREGRAIPTDTLNRGLNRMADVDAAAKAASDAKAWRDTVLSGKASQGAESTRPEVIARNAELARAQGIATAASPAATAGTYVQPEPTGETALDKMMSDDQYNPDVKQGPTPKATPDGLDPAAAAAAAGKEKKSRFNDDDLLMLGLGMMANNRPGTGNKFGDLLASAGQAGIGAVAAKREREKAEMDTGYKDVLSKYYGSLGKKAEADAAYLQSGEKTRAVDRQKALMLVDSGMENWMKTMEGQMPKPGEAAAKRAELTRYYFGGFDLPLPDTMGAPVPGAGFKVLGSRPS